MSWLQTLGNILSGGTNSGARTPPYQGGQQTQGQGGQSQPPWYSYVIPAAAGVASTVLQGRAQNQQNQRLQDRTAMLDQLAKDEQARREYYTSIIMPSILRGMGQRNPQMWAMAKQKLQALPGYGQAQPQVQTPTRDTGLLNVGPAGPPQGATGDTTYDAAWARATGSPYIDPNDPDAWRRT